MIDTKLSPGQVQLALNALELHASTLRTRDALGDQHVAHEMENLRELLTNDAIAAGYNVSYGIVHLAR
jgi:hypothetical protein